MHEYYKVTKSTKIKTKVSHIIIVLQIYRAKEITHTARMYLNSIIH